MRRFAVVLAAALILPMPGARAADLIIWWDEPSYPQEGEALAEVVATFEQGAGLGTSRRTGRRSGPSGATRCSLRCARPRAKTISGPSASRMSVEPFETWLNLRHFMTVHEADYVTRDGRLVIDDPKVRPAPRHRPRPLHGAVPQGLHAARGDHLELLRQQ